MIYTLTTRTGRKYKFYSMAVAEIYRGAYGGEILVGDLVEKLAA